MTDIYFPGAQSPGKKKDECQIVPSLGAMPFSVWAQSLYFMGAMPSGRKAFIVWVQCPLGAKPLLSGRNALLAQSLYTSGRNALILWGQCLYYPGRNAFISLDAMLVFLG